MRRVLLAACAAALAALASEAQATTPDAITAGTWHSDTTACGAGCTLTPTQTIPSGDTAVLSVWSHGTVSPTVTDTDGHTWTKLGDINFTTGHLAYYVSYNLTSAIDPGAGKSLTMTFSTAAVYAAALADVRNAATAATDTTGTTTSTTNRTGTFGTGGASAGAVMPSNIAGLSLTTQPTLLLAAIAVDSGSSSTSFTEDAGNGWTNIAQSALPGAGRPKINLAYKYVTSTTAVLYAPTYGTSTTTIYFGDQLGINTNIAGGGTLFHYRLQKGVGQ